MKKELEPVDANDVEKKVRSIQPDGTSWTVDGVRSCSICGKAIGPTGKKVGATLVCNAVGCETLSLSKICNALRTPYGPAIHLDILAILTRVCYLGPKVICVRSPILERARDIALAYQDLIAWQIAYDTWERQTRSDAWAQGRVQVVPPRYIDEVRAWRSMSAPVVIEPTWRVDKKIATAIHKLYRNPQIDERGTPF